MGSPIESLLARYNPRTAQDYENALKEIIQEIALAGLARSLFFEKAAFYGDTALRIFYDLPRFSEDLDFTLLSPQPDFALKGYFSSVKSTLESFGLEIEIKEIQKSQNTGVDSAFLKANTKMHFLKIETAKHLANRLHRDQKLQIKFEVDIAPPSGFATETKVLPPPITAAIRILSPPHLFAGKMHTIFFRNWQGPRTKGRDYYDLLWYIGQKIPINLNYLEQKMRDGKQWTQPESLTKQDVLELLEAKLKTVDWMQAQQDVARFLKDPKEVESWDTNLFMASIENLKFE